MEQQPEDQPRDKLLGTRDHIRMLWSVAPLFSTVCLIATLVATGCTLLNMIAIGRLLTALAAVLNHHAPSGSVWVWFGVFAGAAILSRLAGSAIGAAGTRVTAAYRNRLDELLAETAMHPRDLGVLESEAFSLRLSSLVDSSRGWLLRTGMRGTWEFVGAKLAAIGSAVIVFGWRWWAPLVIIGCFLLVSWVSRRWLDELLDNLFDKPSVGRQRADYVGRLMIHPEAAKEIRIFGLARWLEHRYVTLWNAYQQPFWRQSNRRLWPLVLVMLLESAVMLGTLGVLAWDAFGGRIAPGQVATVVMAILGLEAFGPMGDTESGLIRTTVFLRNLFGLRRSVGLPELIMQPQPAPTVRAPGAAPIEISNLTFSYPSRAEPTLRQLDLTVPAGQSLAIVGVNGAGKSTLIKLLAGLYQPDSGQIRVDGVDPYGADARGADARGADARGADSSGADSSGGGESGDARQSARGRVAVVSRTLSAIHCPCATTSASARWATRIKNCSIAR